MPGETHPKLPAQLTHLDESGRAKMVGVHEKSETARVAIASAGVAMSQEAFDAVVAASGKKGDALQVARIAGIMAAKKTAELIPLCHPVRITEVLVTAEPVPERLEIVLEATAAAVDRTGVEMEAMTAAAVAALALYDMIKGTDRSASITGVRLLHKSGGKSGVYQRDG